MLGEPGDGLRHSDGEGEEVKIRGGTTQLLDGSGEPAEQAETEFRGAGLAGGQEN